MIEEPQNTQETVSPEVPTEPLSPEVEEMMAAGVHFGHKTSKTHPKMRPYIAGVRNTVHIIDLERTQEKLKEALEFLSKNAAENKKILFVGTKVQIRSLVKEAAQACGVSFVTERWIGGTITNFEVISKRIDRFKDLERQKAEGEFEKYTKREQLDFTRELQDFEVKFGGIKNLNGLPDVVVIFDMDENETAVREARKKGISVVGIVDTNIDPEHADYPIPANDDAISSVKYILDRVQETLLKAKQ
ncbi:MAG: 30S ribosomal protein S2 [Candidatus Yanofskybacteria bacterium]|nr:30S ribosomal protein S2 [Candidatus Yanofskybacteria bacterium]